MVAEQITAPDLFERAIIGSLLVSEDPKKVATTVDENLFASPQGKHAYKILRQAALAGSPFGLSTAAAAIKGASGVVDAYGGHDNAVSVYLEACIEAADPPDSWKSYAHQLQLSYAKRAISQAIDKAQVDAFMADKPEEAVSAALEPVVQAANQLRTITGRADRSMKDMAIDYLEEYASGDDPIPFCQEELNGVGGFRPGNMVFFGAYTGGYKSWWAIDLAVETARLGKKVRYYTLEMSRHEVMERIIGMMDGGASLTVEDLMERRVSSTVLKNYLTMLEELPLTIIDGGCSSGKIMTDTIALGDDKPDVIIVDHMHLLKYASDDKRIGIEDAMRDFKAFAVENKIAMVLLAQLSRPENRTKPPRPSMYMLKEAGGIEQIADLVIMKHVEKELAQGFEQTRDIMWVEKQRQGMAPREFEVSFRRYKIR